MQRNVNSSKTPDIVVASQLDGHVHNFAIRASQITGLRRSVREAAIIETLIRASLFRFRSSCLAASSERAAAALYPAASSQRWNPVSTITTCRTRRDRQTAPANRPERIANRAIVLTHMRQQIAVAVAAS